MTGNTAFTEILILLIFSVVAVAIFNRLRLPSSLGYLLVGIVIGPHTMGLVQDAENIRILAEFGIVFLLFTIGLNFSLPQIIAMRHTVFGFGTAQVALTTVVIGLMAWIAGLPPAAAFVIGAVFAQSSTTIISKQLMEQDEDKSRHGRMGIAMSVFQDVTAVPLVVVIMVLGTVSSGNIAWQLGLALLKAMSAIMIAYFAGHWLLRPLFHEVAARRSPELFTLTVLLVTLVAAGTTEALDLSMALGAFLAGMMLGDTEFRHQIESTIRPFRDVLLGLFFVTIGMLLDLSVLHEIWHWALISAAGLLLIKTFLVFLIVRMGGIDAVTALRIGIVLAVGGEFGFALLAISLDNNVISTEIAQIALTAVLFSMAMALFYIRYNSWFVSLLIRRPVPVFEGVPAATDAPLGLAGHVLICGYGRIGQHVARFLEEEGVPFIALDLDPDKVRNAHASGMPVYYGDSSERDMLEATGINTAKLLVIAHDDLGAARKILHHAQTLRPDLKVMVRTRDEAPVDELLRLGATEVVPETLEASIMIASQVLFLAGVPAARVIRHIREAQINRYELLKELYVTENPVLGGADEHPEWDRLHTLVLTEGATAIGRKVTDLDLAGCELKVIMRDGIRDTHPSPDITLRPNDTLVLLGTPDNLEKCTAGLLS